MPPRLEPLALPAGLTVRDALDRVLRLLSVGSKRFLTTKVDRSVTGLVARQQCAGPLQLTVADVAVIAQSHFGITGAATAIGEQPIKGLLDTRGHGPDVCRRGAHQPGLGPGECTGGCALLGQLDVGGQAAG